MINDLVIPGGKTLVDITTRADLETVEEWVRSGTCADGYLHVTRESSVDLLLFCNKRIHSAVRIVDGVSERLPLIDFVRATGESRTVRSVVRQTDTGLILLMAITLMNRSWLRGPSTIIDMERALDTIAEEAETAAIMLSDGVHRVMCFCGGGKPTVAYFPGRLPARKEDARAQLIEYCQKRMPDAVNIEIFKDLTNRRDHYGDAALESLASGEPSAPGLFLTVRNGRNVVQRKMVKSGNAIIGRDPSCDVVIDHSTVSREHCRIEWESTRFVVKDNGSANGTLINGKRVDTATVTMGDHISVGDFSIALGETEDIAGPGTLETVFLPAQMEVSAQVRLGEAAVSIETPVFTMGRASDVNLQLKGWRVAPINATIVREARAFRILAAPTGRPVTVNGDSLSEEGRVLAAGDEIKIGSNTLVFENIA